MCSALFGGKQSVSTPEIKQVAPSATTITNADIDAGTTADTEAAKKKKTETRLRGNKTGGRCTDQYKINIGVKNGETINNSRCPAGGSADNPSAG